VFGDEAADAAEGSQEMRVEAGDCLERACFVMEISYDLSRSR
jgi:hypothetical protein